MQKQGWKYHLIQIACWLLFLQLVNISVDPPDIHVYHSSPVQKQAKHLNQIESIYELVSEGLLDEEIPEGEGDEPEIEKTFNPVVLFCSKPSVELTGYNPPPLQHQSFYTASFNPLYTDPVSPPPKQA